MKRFMMFVVCLVLILASPYVYAEERAPLGKGNIVLKIGGIIFTHDAFSDDDASGIYFGAEGYGRIMPNIYLGGEVGTAENIVFLFGENVKYRPIELNIKYASDISGNFVFDFGGGASYNYVKYREVHLFSPDVTNDDWLFGGQIFADLTYKISMFSIGINGKYQITEELSDDGIDFNNLRLGFQIGLIF